LRLKILKKLRTASLNSGFTGSFLKKCIGKSGVDYLRYLSIKNDDKREKEKETLKKLMTKEFGN